MEERLQAIFLLLLILHLEKLIRRLVPVIGGVTVHGTHVMKTIRPSLSEVADQEISLW